MKIRKKLPLEVFRDPLGRGRWLACARDSVARRRHRRVAGYRPICCFSLIPRLPFYEIQPLSCESLKRSYNCWKCYLGDFMRIIVASLMEEL